MSNVLQRGNKFEFRVQFLLLFLYFNPKSLAGFFPYNFVPSLFQNWKNYSN